MSFYSSTIADHIESNQRQQELIERQLEENERFDFLLEEDLITTPDLHVSDPTLVKAGDKISTVSSKALGGMSGAGATATTILSIKAAAVGLFFPIATGLITGVCLASLGMKHFTSKPFTITFANSIEDVFKGDRIILKIARLPFFDLKIKPTPSSIDSKILLTIDERMAVDIQKNKHVINGIEAPPNLTIQLTEIEKHLPPREGENYLLINTISKLMNTRLIADLKDKASLYILQNPSLLTVVNAHNFDLMMLDNDISIELTLNDEKKQIGTSVSWKVIEDSKEELMLIHIGVVHNLLDNTSRYQFNRKPISKQIECSDRQPLFQ